MVASEYLAGFASIGTHPTGVNGPGPRFSALLFLGPFAILALGTQPLEAQDVGGLVDGTASTNDPIAVDATSNLGQDPSPSAGNVPPRPARVTPREGAALTAISGIEESDHDVTVELEGGVAHVTIETRLSSRARYPAEVRYRLPRPSGARLTGLSLCVEGRCRAGSIATDAHRQTYDDLVRARPLEPETAAAPIAYARSEEESWTFWIAPVPSRGELTATVRYVAPAPEHGATVRFRLPARARDPRLAPTRIRVVAPGFRRAAIDGAATEDPVSIDPWIPADLSATRPTETTASSSVTPFRCGTARCARVHVHAGPRRSLPTRVIVLVDASPSMLGTARNRIGPAVTSLLAIAPPSSSFRAWSFASRAEAVWNGDVDVTRVPLSTLFEAGTRELGRSTRLDLALEAAAQTDVSGRTVVLLLTDGRIHTRHSLEKAKRTLRRRQVPVYVGMLSDEVASEALRQLSFTTGGTVLALGATAEATLHGERSAPLEERLLAVYREPLRRHVRLRVGSEVWNLGPLFPGESLTWTGPIGRHRPRMRGIPTERQRTDSEWAADWTGTGFEPWSVLPDPPDTRTSNANGTESRPPAILAGGLGSDETPIALAERRGRTETDAPRAPIGPRDGRGIPAETVLRSLRERVVPRARDCLRRDRAGRAQYSVRATYQFELAHREVESLRVSGRLDGALRACLEQTLDGFEVPFFAGRIVVRYPVYTQAEAPPPSVELRTEVARTVDEAVGPYVDPATLFSPSRPSSAN